MRHTQGAASRNRSHVSVSIAMLWRNGKGPLLANAHINQIVIPSAVMISTDACSTDLPMAVYVLTP